MIEKIIVVEPTTAVPMSTGFAVALNVLPAPSFSSRKCLAFSKFTSNPNCDLTSALAFGSCSIVDSSNTDWALSVTGPYESTAMVTGPMPRKPKATRPNANTGETPKGRPPNSATKPCVATRYAAPISAAKVMPTQYAEKLPATRPEMTLSE